MELKKDFDYFLENLKMFSKQYRNKFIVIKNKKVLGVYSTFDEARRKTNETEKEGTYLIQQCLENGEFNSQTFYSYQLIGV